MNAPTEAEFAKLLAGTIQRAQDVVVIRWVDDADLLGLLQRQKDRLLAAYAAACREREEQTTDWELLRDDYRQLMIDNDRLKERLEVRPDHPYDGIHARDETIKLLEQRVEELRAERDVGNVTPP